MDDSDKKVNKHICQGYSVPLLLLIAIPNVTFSSCNSFLFQIITKECKIDRRGLCPPLPPLFTCRRKKGQKQVKKKAFKINATIEDVGLAED